MKNSKINLNLYIIVFMLCNFSGLYTQIVNINPPQQKVNLLWIHHSTGRYWANQMGTSITPYHQRYGTHTQGGNGELALFYNNYILHHLSYGSQLADNEEYTDYAHWYHKFKWHFNINDTSYHASNHAGGSYDNEDLLHCYSANTSYDEQGIDPFTGENLTGQTNQIIMFKSCFPNSSISSSSGINIDNHSEVQTFLDQIGQLNVTQPWTTNRIDRIQCSYIGLLEITARYPDVLFVVWVAPPMTDSVYPLARDFSDWMVHEFLQNYYWDGSQYTTYPYDNVLIFSYWNILTGENNISFNQSDHNHHRFNPFSKSDQYTLDTDQGFINSIQLAYPKDGPSTIDSHPAAFGSALGVKELITRINIQWNKMHNIPLQNDYEIPQSGQIASFPLDSTQSGLTLNAGVSLGLEDNVSCYIFNGTSNAYLDLGHIQFSGNAFSYSYWYRPQDSSVTTGNYKTILHQPGVFESNHISDTNMDSYINTKFDGQYFMNIDRVNNVVDTKSWTHITFTWDGDTARHFVDGIQIVETMIGSRTLGSSINHLFLGNGNGNLLGGIRQVLVYDRELSSNEVRNIFMSTNSIPASNNAPVVINMLPDTTLNEDFEKTYISNLNNIFFDPDTQNLTFFVFSDGNISAIIENDSLSIESQPNFYGVSEVIVRATDGYFYSNDTFYVNINNINDPPSDFNLMIPENNDTLYTSNNTAIFRWERSVDVDNDTSFSYILHLSDQINDTIIDGISDTTFNLTSLNYLQSGNTLDWYVIATDGYYSVVSNDSFRIHISVINNLNDNLELKPQDYELLQNYPNPFNPKTTIKFNLPKSEYVSIEIIDIKGMIVDKILNQKMSEGYHSIEYKGTQLASGIYFYRVKTNSFTATKKMVFYK